MCTKFCMLFNNYIGFCVHKETDKKIKKLKSLKLFYLYKFYYTYLLQFFCFNPGITLADFEGSHLDDVFVAMFTFV